MKKILFFIALLGTCGVFAAQNTRYLIYIDQWKNMAVEQQQNYGIPACITLAQGLLESSAGQSELARKANNHFGIKCTSDWLGGSYYYDDDRKGECFRVYNNAEESFEDHALFLRRNRYAPLFELDIVDYRRWAQGLSACGYATDPSYATKLIAIIEDYGLDTIASSVELKVLSPEGHDRQSRMESLKKPSSLIVESSKVDSVKVAPNEAGEMWVEVKTIKQERKAFYAAHPKEKVNHTPFYFAREGDTYATIAYQLNMKERTLRQYNDAEGHILKPGDRVFVTRKPRYVRGEKSLMWVHPGETLWSISQREGLQLKTIYEVNELDPSVKIFKTRQQIFLAKPKK